MSTEDLKADSWFGLRISSDIGVMQLIFWKLYRSSFHYDKLLRPILLKLKKIS